MSGKPKKVEKKRPQSRPDRLPRGEMLLFAPDVLVTDDDPQHPHHDAARAKAREPDEAMIRNVAVRGVIEPVIYQRKGDLVFVVAGNRRVRAARAANARREKEGLDALRVKAVAYSGADTSGVAMAENHVRQDETPLCSAEWIRRYTEDEGHSMQEAADAMGRTLSWVRATRALLGAAPGIVRAVGEGRLSTTAAAALVRRAPDHAGQEAALEQASEAAAGDRNEPGVVKVRQVAGSTKPNVRKQRAAVSDLSCRADDFARGAAAFGAWVLDGTACGELGLE